MLSTYAKLQMYAVNMIWILMVPAVHLELMNVGYVEAITPHASQLLKYQLVWRPLPLLGRKRSPVVLKMECLTLVVGAGNFVKNSVKSFS